MEGPEETSITQSTDAIHQQQQDESKGQVLSSTMAPALVHPGTFSTEDPGNRISPPPAAAASPPAKAVVPNNNNHMVVDGAASEVSTMTTGSLEGRIIVTTIGPPIDKEDTVSNDSCTGINENSNNGGGGGDDKSEQQQREAGDGSPGGGNGVPAQVILDENLKGGNNEEGSTDEIILTNPPLILQPDVVASASTDVDSTQSDPLPDSSSPVAASKAAQVASMQESRSLSVDGTTPPNNAMGVDVDDEHFDEYIRSPEVQNAIVERSPGGRYVRFMEKLGSGASKDVYRAYDTQEGIEVAWNVVNLSGVPKTERNRIVNEVRLLERLHHHNIISFHGSWVNRERQEVNFVTEILSSGTLKSFINKVQVIRWKIAKRWALQILKGLEYLHSQDPPVIHRDLKCENIFINGTSGDLRIGDLGLSTVHRNGRVLSVLGTPEFMAPDMYEEHSYDEKVDIYAFGMCMLEIFTKEIPYRECHNPAQIYKKVSSGEPPEVLSRLQSRHAREFVLLCLGYKDEEGKYVRPSATELLQHPFLVKRANEDDEVVVDPPLRERAIPEAGEPSSSSMGTPTKLQQQQLKDGLRNATSNSTSPQGRSNEQIPQRSTPPPRQMHPPAERKGSLDEDLSDKFDEMPQTESHIKRVKVMMGRGQELEEDEESPRGTEPTIPEGSPGSEVSANVPAQSFDGNASLPPEQAAAPIPPGEQSSVGSLGQPVQHYLVAAAVIENEGLDTRPYPDDVLKLVVTLPVEGQTQNVQFDFHLVQDDPVQVAKEMVQELGIPQGAVLEISETISGLARSARMRVDNFYSRKKAQDKQQQVQQQPPQQQQQHLDTSNQNTSYNNDYSNVPQHHQQQQNLGQQEYSNSVQHYQQQAGQAPDYSNTMHHNPAQQAPHHQQQQHHHQQQQPPQHQVPPMDHGAVQMQHPQSVPQHPHMYVQQQQPQHHHHQQHQQQQQHQGMHYGNNIPLQNQTASQQSSSYAPHQQQNSVPPPRNAAPTPPPPPPQQMNLQQQGQGNAPIHSQQMTHSDQYNMHGQAQQQQQHHHQPSQPIQQSQQQMPPQGMAHHQQQQGMNLQHQGSSMQLMQPQQGINHGSGMPAAQYPPNQSQAGPSGQHQSVAPSTSYSQLSVESAPAGTSYSQISVDSAPAGTSYSHISVDGSTVNTAPAPTANSGPSVTSAPAQPPNAHARHSTSPEFGSVPNPPKPVAIQRASTTSGSSPEDSGHRRKHLSFSGSLDQQHQQQTFFEGSGGGNADPDMEAELRKLDEDFQRNLQRARKVFDNRMDNLQRSQIEREAQHKKTLEKHEKERAEFEKRLAQEAEQQNRRLEQLQREWDRKRELLAQQKLMAKGGTNGIHSTIPAIQEQEETVVSAFPPPAPSSGGIPRNNSNPSQVSAMAAAVSSENFQEDGIGDDDEVQR